MATKRYLSLEEAAAILKIKTEDLIRLREKGDVRGFADRGTWKFKGDDIQELQRRLQPDSSPEVPMVMDEADAPPRQPTIIKKGRSGSDSDVRLVRDDSPRGKLTGSSAEMPVMGDSDSDVRLAGAKSQELRSSDSDVQLVLPNAPDSDSDVTMAGSDSDVRLTESDSDVRLAPPLSSDSDVQLVERGRKLPSSDSDVSPLARGAKRPAGDALHFDDAPLGGSESILGDDSGIRLDAGGFTDSGISLAGPADSGILLEGKGPSGFGRGSQTLSEGDELDFEDDSGITLEDESGIQLSGDSGIRLDGGDSGIQLDGGDSGIRLSDAPHSGKKQSGKKKGKPQDELDSSVPMLLSDAGNRTDVEVPMIDDDMEVPTLNLSDSKKKKGGDTSVVIFEDDDSEMSLDDSGDLGDSGVADDDDLDVADDLIDDDDEEQLEVFDSDDSVFDESFVEGGSSVAIPAYSGKIQVGPEVEWGTGTISLLICSTIALSLGVMLSADLLRIVWGGSAAHIYKGELIGLFSGLF